jgi:nucleotide-binding universal stress UspA family protein
MLDSILVPLDGSAFGEHALPTALAIARSAGATLRIAHVHQPLAPASIAGVAIPDDVDASMRREEEAYLARAVRRLSTAAPVEVVPALLSGEVNEALQAHVEASGAELVVMATHGRGALGRFWLGSVTDELVRRLRVPLLLVRPRDMPVDLTRLPAFRHIVLPLDGTALAEEMIEPAVALGQLSEARFTLLRIVQPVLRANYLPEGSTLESMTQSYLDYLEAHQKCLVDEARAYLDGVADRLRARGARVEARVVVEDQAAAGILREAERLGADLIALATHGRRGLSRLVMGSVADKVIRAAPMPVLVRRPRGKG